MLLYHGCNNSEKHIILAAKVKKLSELIPQKCSNCFFMEDISKKRSLKTGTNP